MARCYRFGPFTLSCAERRLLRDGRAVALIPRYYDLLVLLLERRQKAVDRNAIRDAVWGEVVVSDGALSQAIRTLRRALDDDPREPRCIRTVSRFGYQFIHPDVRDEDEDATTTNGSMTPDAAHAPANPAESSSRAERIERALAALLSAAKPEDDGDAAREAAEQLHELGTADALVLLDRRPGHARARALLRDTRWDIPGAGEVPLLGQPGGLPASLHLVRLRLRRVLREIESRFAHAVANAALVGALVGALGGAILHLGPGSRASWAVVVVLAVLGGAAGAVGAAGVAAGLALGEALFRSARAVMLIVGGALGGGSVAVLAHTVAQWTLASLFGRATNPGGGGLEGLVIGAGLGLGYALATGPYNGLAAPRHWHRLWVAAVSGLTCGLAAAILGATDHHLGAMSVDVLARSFPGSELGLDPIARLLGEASVGVRTRLLISGSEGLFFGASLAFGLTHRPRG
ncbi:MAG: transcriptional regulator [Vicinamibacteria bacterium]|nr:transcriptional regulator [Vicinamibacteria bacterium]